VRISADFAGYHFRLASGEFFMLLEKSMAARREFTRRRLPRASRRRQLHLARAIRSLENSDPWAYDLVQDVYP